MDKQLKDVDKYYTNLEYDKNVHILLCKCNEIFSLAKEMKFTDVNNFSERFLKAAFVMEKNLSLFQSVCKHVDIITTIIEYLNNIGMQLMFDNKNEEYKKDDVVLLVIFTVSEIYKGLDNTMDVFLENAIL